MIKNFFQIEHGDLTKYSLPCEKVRIG